MTEQSTPSDVNQRMIRNPNVPTIYVEGLSQFMLGFPNSRLLLNSLSQKSTEGDRTEEVHHLACELVIPTAALAELTTTLVGILAGNKDTLKNAGAEWIEKVNSAVELCKPTDAAPLPPTP